MNGRRFAIAASYVCVLLTAIAWASSYLMQASFAVPMTSSTKYGVLSASGNFILCVQRKEQIDQTWAVTTWASRSYLLDVDGIEWGVDLLVVRVGRAIPCLRSSGIESTILVIPYWALLGPLMFTAAVLRSPSEARRYCSLNNAFGLAALAMLLFLFAIAVAPVLQRAH